MAKSQKGQIFSADFAIAAALFATALALFMSASQSNSALRLAASQNAALLDASMQAASLAASLCSQDGSFEGRFDTAAVNDFFALSQSDYESVRGKLGLLQGSSNYDFSATLSVPSGIIGHGGRNPPSTGSKSVFRRNGMYGSQGAILEVEVWER